MLYLDQNWDIRNFWPELMGFFFKVYTKINSFENFHNYRDFSKKNFQSRYFSENFVQIWDISSILEKSWFFDNLKKNKINHNFHRIRAYEKNEKNRYNFRKFDKFEIFESVAKNNIFRKYWPIQRFPKICTEHFRKFRPTTRFLKILTIREISKYFDKNRDLLNIGLKSMLFVNCE